MWNRRQALKGVGACFVAIGLTRIAHAQPPIQKFSIMEYLHEKGIQVKADSLHERKGLYIREIKVGDDSYLFVEFQIVSRKTGRIFDVISAEKTFLWPYRQELRVFSNGDVILSL